MTAGATVRSAGAGGDVSTADGEARTPRSTGQRIVIGAVIAVAVPGVILRLVEMSASDPAHDTELILVSLPYLVLAMALFVRHRHDLRDVVRDGLRTPYSELVGDPS